MSFQMLSDRLIPCFIQIITWPSDFLSTMGKIKKGNDLSWQPWLESEWHYYVPRLISAHSMQPIEKTEEGHRCFSASHSLIGWYIIEMLANLNQWHMLLMTSSFSAVGLEIRHMAWCTVCKRVLLWGRGSHVLGAISHYVILQRLGQCSSLQSGYRLITPRHSGRGLV